MFYSSFQQKKKKKKKIEQWQFNTMNQNNVGNRKPSIERLRHNTK